MLALRPPPPPHIHTHTFTEQSRTMPGVSIPPRMWLSSQARWELLERVLLLHLESGGLGQPMCPGLTHPRLPLSSFPQSHSPYTSQPPQPLLRGVGPGEDCPVKLPAVGPSSPQDLYGGAGPGEVGQPKASSLNLNAMPFVPHSSPRSSNLSHE